MRRPVVVASAVLVIAATVTAALLIRQDVAVTPESVAPDVTFAQGNDYAGINTAGFATLTVGNSGTSASLSAGGIPGAAFVGLEDVMAVQNTGTAAYTISVARSAPLDGAVGGFRILIEDSTDAVIIDWDAVASESSAPFSLPAGTTYDISVYPSIADGTPAGDLGGFDIQFSIAPA